MAPQSKPSRFSSAKIAALFGFLAFFVYSFLSSHLDSSDGSFASLVKRDAWSDAATTHNLTRRDDYSCGKGKPCANGACCGKSGYCGYGPTYCGSGCVSNCNAKAECGEYASPAGKKCPLNTCCSQYGFCGTTDDFCGTKCQSNCVLHPSPPGGGGGGTVLKNVVGYYESWSQRSSCHKRDPTDLPLDYLTHLNYAFAYIDPGSYKLVTMDGQTPASSFMDTTKAKQVNPSLKVFISVGGWTFSDNGTATQPLFGKIAASSALRQTFAKNCLTFMNQYGFDGIDIDWEYPGAPDRGGKTEDTANFVLLMQTLRSTFNNSPRNLGITFTAPSSYWYLRWFDIPGLLKYADWINFMTYDLHGVWDRNNPIGSIVQGHTNLTEIGLALELLWRVKTPPSKVYMGFGFYGRSFQLANANCKTPGCQFSGGAAPGPCSKTSGVLLHYEIQAIMKQHPDLKPTYDQKAAVKYLVFNNNQWVSYDDKDTFQQKITWANKQGLGGSLIWASDTDDDQYTAHAGFFGKTVLHPDTGQEPFNPNPDNIAKNLIGQNGQNCKVLPDCVYKDNPQVSGCPSGQTRIGWAKGYLKDDCGGGGYGKRICCDTATAPKQCTWRGSGPECNGVCHVGEANLFTSSWGGWPYEDGSGVSKCNRGTKIFCCAAGDWKDVADGCRWTGCGDSCNSDEDEVHSQASGDCYVWAPNKKYCCPHPTKFGDCTWRGTAPDCADNQCEKGEVTVAQTDQGSSFWGCTWGRKKSMCCSVNKEPSKPVKCSRSYCDADPSLCEIDSGNGVVKRSLDGLNVLAKRGGGDPREFSLADVALLVHLFMYSLRYTPYGDLYAGQQGQTVLRQSIEMNYGSCDDTLVHLVLRNPPGRQPDGVELNTEHPIDLNVHPAFVRSLGNNVLPGGARYQGTVPSVVWLRDYYLNENYRIPGNLDPVIPGGRQANNPEDRVWEAWGSTTNRRNFMAVDAQINQAKNYIMREAAPIATNRFNNAVRASANDGASTDVWLNELRATVGMFRYLQTPEAASRFRDTNNLIRAQMTLIENRVPGGQGLRSAWDQFFPRYLTEVQNFAQQWLSDRIDFALTTYRGTSTPARFNDIITTLNNLRGQISSMHFPSTGN